jgi:hypothetical protein
MKRNSGWVGPAPAAAESAYNSTVTGAAATTPSAFRHHHSCSCRASDGRGNSGIQKPMLSPSPLRQLLLPQQVNANRPKLVRLDIRAGSGQGGIRFGLGPDSDRVGADSDWVGPDSDLVMPASAAAESA